MQKRTNPLELKVESKDYTPAPAPAEKKTAVSAAPEAEQTTPQPETALPPKAEQPPKAEPTVAQDSAPVAPTVAAPAQPEQPAAAATETVETKEATAETTAPVAQAEPTEAPAPAQPEQPAVQAPVRPVREAAADRVAPVRPNRPAPKRPIPHTAADDRVRHGEQVADNDVAVAVKFRVAGDHVERRMVLARVSRDVCKLAQALYPEQSMGQIIESALLTRAFLQDRDAFDAAAREIIKKGGKIKC